MYSTIPINVKEKKIEITPIDEETFGIPIKRKRGRPKRSTELLNKDVDDKLDIPTKRKPGRPRRRKKSLKKKIDVPIKKEEKDTEPISTLPIKRKRGRPKGSGRLSIKKEEEQIRKRSSVLEENNNEDEISMDDISLAIRHSLRFRNASIKEPTISPV